MIGSAEYSIDDWTNLLEPYGYVDITVHAPASAHGSPHIFCLRFDIMLKENPADIKLDEWERRLKALNTAKQAVEAVQARGFNLDDAPRIEFGGHYYHRFGCRDMDWSAEARLVFEVYTTN